MLVAHRDGRGEELGIELPLAVLFSVSEGQDRIFSAAAVDASDRADGNLIPVASALQTRAGASRQLASRGVPPSPSWLAVLVGRGEATAVGALEDQTPLAILGHGIFPQLTDASRFDLDQLFEANRQTPIPRLKDLNRLSILQPSGDQLFFFLPLNPLTPLWQSDGKHDAEHRHGNDESDHRVALLGGATAVGGKMATNHYKAFRQEPFREHWNERQ